MANIYKILQGDTLGNIATSNKTDVATLMKLNPNIQDPNKIFAGASLTLPDVPKPAAAGPTVVPPPSPLASLTGGSGAAAAVATSDSLRIAEEKKKADQAKADLEAKAELDRLATAKGIADLKMTVTPTGGAPVKPNLEAAYTGLLSENNAAGQSYNSLQQKVVDLNAKKEEAMAQLKTFEKVTPEGVSAGFAQGTISKEQQAVQDIVDGINREITTTSLMISNRADVINSLMGLKKEDYANSSAAYDKELTTNLNLYNALGTQKDKLSDNARASLQIIQNQIATGKTKYEDMTPDQRATVDNLEVQAGYPKGFTQFLTANVKADIVSTNSRTADDGTVYFDVLTRNPDGSFGKTTITAGKGKAPASGKSLSSQQYTQLAAAGVDQETADMLVTAEIQGRDPADIRAALEADNMDPNLYDVFYKVYKP